MCDRPAVRLASPSDAEAIGRLLHDFNLEFDQPTPQPGALAARVRQLMNGGDTSVLLTEHSDGLVVLRYRQAIWTEALECWLAELYVEPRRRGQGLGRTLVEAALADAQQRGADRIEVATSEDDVAARTLYEKFGFSKGEGPDTTYFYERGLDSPIAW